MIDLSQYKEWEDLPKDHPRKRELREEADFIVNMSLPFLISAHDFNELCKIAIPKLVKNLLSIDHNKLEAICNAVSIVLAKEVMPRTHWYIEPVPKYTWRKKVLTHYDYAATYVDIQDWFKEHHLEMTEESIALDRAIKRYGGARALARELGYKHAAISQAMRRGRVSTEMALKIHRITDGEIHAYDLRPDIRDLGISL